MDGKTFRDGMQWAATWVGRPALVAYGISMFIYPWFAHDWQWQKVQVVWKAWQELNVGFLALAASVLALNISNIREDQRRKKQLEAALALLPMTLADLVGYCTACTAFLLDAGGKVKDRNRGIPIRVPNPFAKEIPLPPIPAGLDATFTRCIENGDELLSKHLARILVLLQINHSRLETVRQALLPAPDHSGLTLVRHNIVSYLYGVLELRARLSPLFNFARGRGTLEDRAPSEDELHNAALNMRLGSWEAEVNEYVQHILKTRDSNDHLL